MPLHGRPDRCAVVERAGGGQWGDNCSRPPVGRAVWRFVDESRRILLCDQRAAELDGHERLSAVTRFYDATAEG